MVTIERDALRRELGTTALEYFDLGNDLTFRFRLRPQGETTDLLNGLERTLEQSSGKPASGILVLSDGADQAVLGATPPAELVKEYGLPTEKPERTRKCGPARASKRATRYLNRRYLRR